MVVNCVNRHWQVGASSAGSSAKCWGGALEEYKAVLALIGRGVLGGVLVAVKK